MITEGPVSTSARADRNGYLSVGSGPHKVIVLHGWLADAESWAPAWEFADQDRFTWCFMDARGYGRSRERRGEYSIEEYARDALDVADELGWSDFSLVGHSMAGLAIQRVLLAAPERVRALVAVAAVPATGGELVGQRRELFDGAVTDPQARAAVVDHSTGSRHSQEWIERFTTHSFACAEADAVRCFLDSWADGDFHAEIVGNPVRLGVVIGAHDPSLDAQRMARTWLAWYPSSRLEVLDGAGHYPMQEQPEALMSAVHGLLTETARVG